MLKLRDTFMRNVQQHISYDIGVMIVYVAAITYLKETSKSKVQRSIAVQCPSLYKT
jgi:hypothetical protein